MLLVATAQQPAEAARAILDRAIDAAGGAEALATSTRIEWTAAGTMYTPAGAQPIEGRWILQPPGTAEVSTWTPGKPSAVQRTVLDATSAWTETDGVRTALPASAVAHYRDQYYVLSVMRLLPLRDPDVELSVVSPRTLLVRHARHPDLEASFGDDGRLTLLRTTISHPENNSDIVHEVRLAGTISGGGITWPRTIRVTHDGKPYLDLQLTELTASRQP